MKMNFNHLSPHKLPTFAALNMQDIFEFSPLNFEFVTCWFF